MDQDLESRNVSSVFRSSTMCIRLVSYVGVSRHVARSPPTGRYDGTTGDVLDRKTLLFDVRPRTNSEVEGVA